MSIEFNDENQGVYNQFNQQNQVQQGSKFANMLISMKIVSTPEQANKVLLGIAVTSFLLTLFVVFKFIL